MNSPVHGCIGKLIPVQLKDYGSLKNGFSS